MVGATLHGIKLSGSSNVNAGMCLRVLIGCHSFLPHILVATVESALTADVISTFII